MEMFIYWLLMKKFGSSFLHTEQGKERKKCCPSLVLVFIRVVNFQQSKGVIGKFKL